LFVYLPKKFCVFCAFCEKSKNGFSQKAQNTQKEISSELSRYRQQLFEQDPAVGITEEGIRSPFRVRHEAEYVTACVADTGDIVEAAVRIGGVGYLTVGVTVPEQDLIVVNDLFQRGFVGKIAAFRVRNGNFVSAGKVEISGKERVVGRCAEVHVLAVEFLVIVSQENTRQQAGFNQYLESVADTQYVPTGIGVLDDFVHNGREPGDSAASQVVAITETTGNDEEITSFEVGRFVPEFDDFLTQDMSEYVNGIVVTIRTGEDYYAEFH
jgi:hypothetical protein